MRLKFPIYILFFSLILASALPAVTNVAILHLPLSKFGYPGKDMTLSVSLVTQSCSVSSVTLMYRYSGDQYFSGLSMVSNSSNTSFSAELQTLASVNSVYEYFIQVRDNFGNYYWLPERPDTSTKTFSCIVSPLISGVLTKQGGKLELPDDNPNDNSFTGIVFQANLLSEDVNVNILNRGAAPYGLVPPAGTQFVEVYDFYGTSKDGKAVSLAFNENASLKLKYFDENNDGIVDGTSINENSLHLFWYDGLKWHEIGSSIDTGSDFVSAQVSHLGLFAITSEPSASLDKPQSILQSVSHPSFSPLAGEICVFGLKDPASIFEINIYNQVGRLVRRLDSNSWDGRDDQYQFVKSGVYIYQVKAAGKAVSGMLLVRY